MPVITIKDAPSGCVDLIGRLRTVLQPIQRVAVALSGGVDSAVLAAAAALILGPDQVLTLTVEAPMVPAADRADAVLAAGVAGVPHQVLHLPADILGQFPFNLNPADRCYHCKKLIFNTIRAAADECGFAILADGTNADDLHEDRPGLQALRELNVRSPLAEAGLHKADVRLLAAWLCPGFAAKPAMACLATRVPTGTPITLEVLQRIDQAEQQLRTAGWTQVRVRAHGDLARVEIDASQLNGSGLAPALIAQLRTILHAAGFRYATIDLDGYRLGSMQQKAAAQPGGDERVPG